MIYLLIKEQRTNSGFSRQTLKAFTNPDLAKLSQVKCNHHAEQFTRYFIEEIRLNDSEVIDMEGNADEVTVFDEQENEYYLSSKYDWRETNEGERYAYLDRVEFYGHNIESLGLTTGLVRSIINEAENALEKIEE